MNCSLVIVDFARLTSLCSTCEFSIRCSPPSRTGTMWSRDATVRRQSPAGQGTAVVLAFEQPQNVRCGYRSARAFGLSEPAGCSGDSGGRIWRAQNCHVVWSMSRDWFRLSKDVFIRLAASIHVVGLLSGFRDVTEPALADDVPPALNHAVGGALPGIAEHHVVAKIGVEPRFQLGCRLSPVVAMIGKCFVSWRLGKFGQVKQTVSIWGLFPLAARRRFRVGEPNSRPAPPCHVGRRTTLAHVAASRPLARSSERGAGRDTGERGRTGPTPIGPPKVYPCSLSGRYPRKLPHRRQLVRMRSSSTSSMYSWAHCPFTGLTRLTRLPLSCSTALTCRPQHFSRVR